MLDVVVVKRRRSTWEWQVREQNGVLIMRGREQARPAARYQGYRALFMLLASGWKLNDQPTERESRRTRP